MAKTSFIITHTRTADYPGTADMKARPAFDRVANFMAGCAGGAYGATQLAVGTTAASGHITISGASGPVIVFLAGVEIDVGDAQVTDELTAIEVANAINDPGNGVAEAVTAEAFGNVVQVVANFPGVLGNYVAFGAQGTGVEASDTTLLGGVTTTYDF